MSNSTPLVSTIVPAYNAEKYLAAALESVLQQKYRSLEIIVVDDGSGDRTSKIAASFGKHVRYVYQKNAGAAAARNTGLELARGEIIAFIDADDLWTADKLETQLDYFRKNPQLEVVLGRVQCITAQQIAGETRWEKFSYPSINVNLGAGLYRKEVFETWGNFNSELEAGEDVDWFMRLRENRVAMVIIEPVTLYYRLHEANMVRDRQRSNAAFVVALKRSLDRRRRQGSHAPTSLSNLKYLGEPKSQG